MQMECVERCRKICRKAYEDVIALFDLVEDADENRFGATQ